MDYGLERAFYNLSEQIERLTADSLSASSSADSAAASDSGVSAGTGAGAVDLEAELDLSGTGGARESGSTLASLRSAASLSYPRFKFLLAALAAFLGTLLAFPGAAPLSPTHSSRRLLLATTRTVDLLAQYIFKHSLSIIRLCYNTLRVHYSYCI